MKQHLTQLEIALNPEKYPAGTWILLVMDKTEAVPIIRSIPTRLKLSVLKAMQNVGRQQYEAHTASLEKSDPEGPKYPIIRY